MKELLRQYNDLLVEIKDIEKKIIKLEKIECKFEKDNVTGSNPYFPYEKKNFNIEGFNILEEEKRNMRLDRIKKILYKRKCNCENMKIEIEEFINSIPDSRTRRVFQYRYIDDLEWLPIARKIGKHDESYPRKIIHDRYLNSL